MKIVKGALQLKIFVFILICYPFSVIAENNIRIDSSVLEVRDVTRFTIVYAHKKDFQYAEGNPGEVLSFMEIILQKLRSFLSRIFHTTEGFNLQKFLFYLIMISGMLLLVYFLFKSKIQALFYSNPKRRNYHPAEGIENINTIDIDHELGLALAEENYRGAIRYYYLKLLKLLADKELIIWRIDKTNHDYIFEMRGKGINDKLPYLSKLYETVWYGNYQLNSEQYKYIAMEFDAYHKSYAVK